MSYLALYRKLRPQIFEDIVEQQHIVQTLKNSVLQNRIAHAYLFCGTRGTGKTSMAQIFARAVNCLAPADGNPCNECEICQGILSGTVLDVLEIDAASNNSVDNIRQIRDEVVYTPSQARYKVYIIDEVHMLSTGAFNALLKTLEEPPAHVIFILATTEAHRLPATILSRCQRFDFHRITVESINNRLQLAVDELGAKVEPRALKLIASLADGAMRDAYSILDQCMTMGNEISYNDVLSIVGIVKDDFISEFADSLYNKDINGLLKMVDKLLMDGKEISTFVSDLIKYYRDLLIVKMTDNPEDILETSEDAIISMKAMSDKVDVNDLTFLIRRISAISADLKWSTQPRIIFEVELIKLCTNLSHKDMQLEEKVALLEKRIFELENMDLYTGIQNQKSESVQKGLKVDPIQLSSDKIESSKGYTESNGPKKPAQPTESTEPIIEDTSAVTKPLENPDIGAGKPLAIWNKVLSYLKKSGKMNLFSSLTNTKALQTGEHQVSIIFESNSDFLKKAVSKPENIDFLQKILSKSMRKDIRVKCYTEDEFSPDPVQEVPAEVDFENKARLIAKKLDVPFNITDE